MLPRVVQFVSGVIDADMLFGCQTAGAFFVRSVASGGSAVLVEGMPSAGAWLGVAQLYRRLEPLSDGEIILDTLEGEGIYQPAAEPPRRIHRSELAGILGEHGIDDLLQRFDVAEKALLFISRQAWPGNFGELHSGVKNTTWVGGTGLAASLRAAKYRVRIGAGEFILKPSEGEYVGILESEPNTHVCFYKSGSNPGVEVPIRVFSGRSGVQTDSISASNLVALSGFDSSETYGFDIRSTLRIDMYCREGDANAIEKIQWAVKDADPVSTESLRHELSNDVLESKRRKLESLQRRIDAVQSRRRLTADLPGGHTLNACIPTNENETVILATRLEGLIANHGFPGFRILEYTSREGIDALVRCQFGEGAPCQIHAAEFEFDVRSFFLHGHPFQQVEMIVCWTAQALQDGVSTIAELGAVGGRSVEILVGTSGWTRSIAIAGHSIRVLPLDRLCKLIGE